MGNLFTALPAPAANGSGAAVDVSAYGAKKTFIVSGLSGAHVTIEMSNQLVPTLWAPVLGLNPANSDRTLDIAARWMRATVSNYDTRAAPAAPVVNLAGNDDGATAATLIAPAVDGAGAAVNVAALPEFKTVHVGGPFTGALQVEMSADAGVTWANQMSFSGPGQMSAVFTANRMRVTRNGVDGGAAPVINIEATVPGGGGSGGAAAGQGAVTSQWTAIVDPALGNDATGTFGNLERPYATIQGALSDIPIPADAAGARTVWTVLVSPGTYDEDLAVDLTHGKKVVLASWGPWNLGLFEAADFQPSGPARSIAITTSDAVVFDAINGSLSIQPMMPPSLADETQEAISSVPRISGQITMTGVFAATPLIDVTLQAVVYGIANAAIVAGAADISLRVHRSRMRGTVTGVATTLSDATESRFEDLLTLLGYGRIGQCFFGDGMTTTAAAPMSNTVPGFYDCQLTGVFTGLAGSYWFDLVTDYWFKTNACAFAGGATRTVIETIHPAPLPEQWAQNNVPANTPATAMSAQVSTNFDEIKMMRPGSIVGISSRLTEAVTAGLLQVDATINGVIVPAAALNISMAIGSSGGQTLAAPGIAPYVAGDLVGIKFTTDVAFTPITTNLEAWLEILEEIP
jgi:hypothetical protein